MKELVFQHIDGKLIQIPERDPSKKYHAVVNPFYVEYTQAEEQAEIEDAKQRQAVLDDMKKQRAG